MTKPQKEHDKLASRLALILTKLNDGQRLSTKELAQEFNISTRTVQRDMSRLSYLPIEYKEGHYFLASFSLGKLSFSDIKRFATFSGIGELFPELSDSLIIDILNQKTSQSMGIKGFDFEDLSQKVELFNKLAAAILNQYLITFNYSDKPRLISPYRLMNIHGIWYLVGAEEGNIKHFTVSKISSLMLTDNYFKQDKEILKVLQDHKGTWVSQNSKEVIVFINNEASDYFLRRKLLPDQVVLRKEEHGIVLSATISYDEELLALARYWIPHLTILQPTSLQQKLEETLTDYLKQKRAQTENISKKI